MTADQLFGPGSIYQVDSTLWTGCNWPVEADAESWLTTSDKADASAQMNYPGEPVEPTCNYSSGGHCLQFHTPNPPAFINPGLRWDFGSTDYDSYPANTPWTVHLYANGGSSCIANQVFGPGLVSCNYKVNFTLPYNGGTITF
jgi:hypothetical protein